MENELIMNICLILQPKLTHIMRNVTRANPSAGEAAALRPLVESIGPMR